MMCLINKGTLTFVHDSKGSLTIEYYYGVLSQFQMENKHWTHNNMFGSSIKAFNSYRWILTLNIGELVVNIANLEFSVVVFLWSVWFLRRRRTVGTHKALPYLIQAHCWSYLVKCYVNCQCDGQTNVCSSSLISVLGWPIPVLSLDWCGYC